MIAPAPAAWTPLNPAEVRPLPHPDKRIRDQVDAALANLRDGERFAVVVGADLERGRAAVFADLGRGFSFVTYGEKQWGGPAQAGVAIVLAR